MEQKELTKNFNLFLILLGITFIILKLTLVIDWNWFLVLLPLIYRFLGGWIILLLILIWAFTSTMFNYKKVTKINKKVEKKNNFQRKTIFEEKLTEMYKKRMNNEK